MIKYADKNKQNITHHVDLKTAILLLQLDLMEGKRAKAEGHYYQVTYQDAVSVREKVTAIHQPGIVAICVHCFFQMVLKYKHTDLKKSS